MSGLKKWLDEKWVDIGAPKKNGKYQPCGRQKGSKRAYPKCVPLAKARSMSAGQKASAVKRKRAASNTGPKPTNVATFTKRQKAQSGGRMEPYRGRFIKGDLGGKKVSNPSLVAYYGKLLS